MIDLHAHILPAIDDGARDWSEALEMARIAVQDGIATMVATPHLFSSRSVNRENLNPRSRILDLVAQLQEKVLEEGLALTIVPGCDAPLCFELMELLERGEVLTINDQRRYLLLEMPDTAIPPATEDVCFQLMSKGITPIITHPERNLLFHEMPNKLVRLLNIGCLAQVTAKSLVGGFGKQVAKFARTLTAKGYIHLMASDAHNTTHRPPRLTEAVMELGRIVGRDQAQRMVTTLPGKIVRGEPW